MLCMYTYVSLRLSLCLSLLLLPGIRGELGPAGSKARQYFNWLLEGSESYDDCFDRNGRI